MQNNKTLLTVVVAAVVAILVYGALNMPDRRTPGEKISDAVDELKDRTPGEKLGDAVDDMKRNNQ